jgi:hypothetical protein
LVTVPIFLKSGCWSLLLLIWIRLLVTVPIFKNQAVGHCCYYFGSGCWLLFTLFWIKLLITVHIIFGSACWLLFLLFWIRLLVTVPIIFYQPVGHCSHYFGSDCW